MLGVESWVVKCQKGELEGIVRRGDFEGESWKVRALSLNVGAVTWSWKVRAVSWKAGVVS